MIHPSVAVLEHHLVGYRRVWRGSVFSSFVLPVLFLLGLGTSVGRFVDADSGLGVPYAHYIAPGLLASTALQVAVGETTWPVFTSMRWSRTYEAMRATPLRASDILAGQMMMITLRLSSSAAGFLVVMALFGALHSWRAVAAVPAAVLAGLAVATPIFGYSVSISSDSMFALLYRFAVIPMTLFAGVFFPVDGMPLAARWLAYLSPLWHGVELSRAATLGGPTAWGVWVHTGYLLTWAVVGYVSSLWIFNRRLTRGGG